MNFHMKIQPCFLPKYTRNRHPTIYGQGGRCPLRGFLKIVTKLKRSTIPLSLKAILNQGELEKTMRKKTETVLVTKEASCTAVTVRLISM